VASVLQLYKIAEDEISTINLILPEDVALVYDEETKNLYLYRSKNYLKLDEFQSTILYERILNRFLNPNIYYIRDLTEIKGDTGKTNQIKRFIQGHRIKLFQYNVKQFFENLFLLKNIRQKIEDFKRFEHSREWRTTFSNQTNIWRLSIFNLISILIITLMLVISYTFVKSDYISELTNWNLWLKYFNFIFIISVTVLGFVFLINLLFVLFPLKFPIHPKMIEKLSGSSKELKMIEVSAPPTPKLPPEKEQITKSSPSLIKIDLRKSSSSQNTSMKAENSETYDVPEIPLKKKVESQLIPNTKEIQELTKLDTSETKYVVVDCPLCKKNISTPIPKKLITNSQDPVTEISFLHGSPQHVVIIQLDHDFQVRRRRASPIVIEK
jgi:hypothetical protein